MAQFEADITITLRPSILDPQGKATSHALDQLGFDSVKDVRIGKNIRLTIVADSADKARETAREACEKLLANPVMEDFRIDVRETELESS
ncbi:MAG: phosphoribosylformylglycinamidine synthase subunit PurS [Rhodothermales bacterium]|nr:phosphoribosylformylglycinamidine synthase subunit PurS [Rhodothermales bacterium]